MIDNVSVVLLSFYFCFKGKRIRILCTDVIITTFMYHLFISAQHHPHCSLIGFATLRIPFSFLFFSKCKLVAKFMQSSVFQQYRYGEGCSGDRVMHWFLKRQIQSKRDREINQQQEFYLVNTVLLFFFFVPCSFLIFYVQQIKRVIHKFVFCLFSEWWSSRKGPNHTYVVVYTAKQKRLKDHQVWSRDSLAKN